HAAGVVHCDLKPSNVLLSQDGPRVIDFGISRGAEVVSVTGAGLVVGSPGFMSPEQAMGQEIGPPSDIFSLGAVLTFAATGGGPFGKGSSPELAYRLVYGPPNLGGLPGQLRPLVERCLAKDPRERPTADEVLAEAGAVRPATGWPLGAFAPYIPPNPAVIDASPGEARPPARITSRRWRRPLAAAGVMASVLTAFVMVSLAPRSAPAPRTSAQFAPRATATWPPSRPTTSRSPRAPASTGSEPPPDIIPALVTVTSPATSAGRSSSPSATATATKPPRASASPTTSPSATASASATASPSPTPSPSAPPAPPVPQIMSAGTYQQGTWVYFDVQYADRARTPRASALWASMALSGWRRPIPSRALIAASSGRIASPIHSTCNVAPLSSTKPKSRSGFTTRRGPAANPWSFSSPARAPVKW